MRASIAPTHQAANAVRPPAMHAVADLESQLAGAGVDVPPAHAAAAATAEAPIIPEDFWSPTVTGGSARRSVSGCTLSAGEHRQPSGRLLKETSWACADWAGRAASSLAAPPGADPARNCGEARLLGTREMPRLPYVFLLL